MKKKFTTLFLFAATMLVALTFTACGEDVNIPDELITEGKTEFATEGKKSLGDATRTTCDKDRYFYWTPGDNIWVEKTAGNWVESTSNTITATQGSAKFYFNEALPEETYNVRYTGYGSTSATSVSIASSQTQSDWDNCDHIAVSGDCGLATATHQGERKYKFSLRHQASYIFLHPYMVSSIPAKYPLDRTYTLMKVEVKSTGNAEIAGTYKFGSTGITGAATSSASDMITLNCGTNGFALENNSNPSKHFVVIVMRPIENNKLTFTYYVKDNTDGTIFTYDASPGIRTYHPNGFTFLTHQISDMVFNPTYYKWGSTAPWSISGSYNSTLVQPSEYNTGVWQYAPNINEMLWYAKKGNVCIDNNTRWRYKGDGTVYTNGAWILKKNNIDGFNAATGPDGDMRNNVASLGQIYTIGTAHLGRPGSSEAQELYFYLPCFGYIYDNTGNHTYRGTACAYWSRSATSRTNGVGVPCGPELVIGSDSNITIQQSVRPHGMVVGQGWFQ